MRTTLKRGAGRGQTNGRPPDLAGAAVAPPPPPPPALGQVARYGGGGRRRLRLTGKILLWLVVVLLVAAGGFGGGIYIYLNRSVETIEQNSKAIKENISGGGETLPDVASPDQPTNALIIGYDARAGTQHTVGLSDTIMLVRADPRTHSISLLSIPRDLQVDVPPCGGRTYPVLEKINAAYAECGPVGTLKTVESLTDLDFNYVIAVNFSGFKKIVDQVGGVYLDVDRRYYNPTGGVYATINLQPGYQLLKGDGALDYARYRHTDSDFYRIARQQIFVKALKQAVQTHFSLTKLPGIIKVIEDSVLIAHGKRQLALGTILGYAKFIYELPSGHFYQTKLENITDTSTSSGEFIETLPSDSFSTAVRNFLNPDLSAATKATEAARGQKPSGSQLDPKDTTIEVLNGNSVDGAASNAAFELSQLGYKAASGGNALDASGNPKFDYFDTVVLYNPSVAGAAAASLAVANLFDGDAEQAPPDVHLSTTLRVIVGKTYHGTIASAPTDSTPQHEPPTTVRSFDAVLPYIRDIRHKTDFPLLVPTLTDRSSSLDTTGVPFRKYRLEHHDAIKIVYHWAGSTGGYWGVEETGWTDAPILDGPNREIKVGNRTLELYFDGSHLHMVAFVENGAAYWVTNTLLDDLSNETMIAIAKGLQPLAALNGA